MNIKLKIIEETFSVCKVKDYSEIDLQAAFVFIGILAKISTCLAENGIGIFAISTFNTDYILTKAENFEKAVKTLEAKEYKIC